MLWELYDEISVSNLLNAPCLLVIAAVQKITVQLDKTHYPVCSA